MQVKREQVHIFECLFIYILSPDHPDVKVVNNVFYLLSTISFWLLTAFILAGQKTGYACLHCLYLPSHILSSFCLLFWLSVLLCICHIWFKFLPESLGRKDGRTEKEKGDIEVDDRWPRCCRKSSLLSGAIKKEWNCILSH